MKEMDTTWKPSFVNGPEAPYFKNRAWEFACYLMEMGGTLRESKLCLREVEDYNKEMADIWYEEVAKILKSGDLPEMFLERCLAKAKSLAMDKLF